jgi:hypothetical protein
MSRVLRAGTAIAPAADVESSAPRGWALQDLPSGLASLVIHFTALIILGLTVTQTHRPQLAEVTVDWQEPGDDALAGGGGGKDGLDQIDQPPPLDEEWTEAADALGAAVPAADELVDSAQFAATSEFSNLSAEVAPLSGSDALADLASMGEFGLRSMGTGGGTGGGRGRGNGPGAGDGTGPGSKTGLFGLRDEGSRIVYVFDRSESMNSVFTLTDGDREIASVTSLDAAKQELIKSVNELADGGQFQMIFYNDAPLPFLDHYQVNGLSKADAKTKEAATQFIYQLVAERNTNHVAALLMALKLKPDVIFLLTDGEAKDDPTSGDLRAITKQARKSNTRINVIHFCYEERPNSSLVTLAKRTQGQFKSIPIRSLVDPNW